MTKLLYAFTAWLLDTPAQPSVDPVKVLLASTPDRIDRAAIRQWLARQ